MAIFQLTSTQIALFASATALAGGFGIWGALHYHGSNPPWGAVATDEEFLKEFNDNSFAKKYAQLLVHPTGYGNYQNSSVNNRYWWDKQWYKYEKDLKNENHSLFRNVEISYLSISCYELYKKAAPEDNTLSVGDDERVLWKYCSPLGVKPSVLANQTGEYSAYCERAGARANVTSSIENGFCVSPGAGANDKYLLASTGLVDLQKAEYKNITSLKEMPFSANPIFWAIKDQWFRWLVDYKRDELDKGFEAFVKEFSKELKAKTSRLSVLREVCEEAYDLASRNQKQNVLTPKNLVKYCGISATWKPSGSR